MKKKISNFFKRLFNKTVFIDHTKLQNHDGLKVLVINPESKDLAETLGITIERAIELQVICSKALRSSKSFGDIMESVSTKVKSINEIWYSSMLINVMGKELGMYGVRTEKM